jgi:hypothetical protein
MMMGGLALAGCLIPLIAAGMLVVALISALMGKSTDLLEQLLPPGILPDPTGEKTAPDVNRHAFASHNEPSDHAVQPIGYDRSCHECGWIVQYRWDYCPHCGARFYWD